MVGNSRPTRSNVGPVANPAGPFDLQVAGSFPRGNALCGAANSLSEWETVRRIEFLRGRTRRRTQRLPIAPVVELVSHPVMRSLKELYSFELEPLLELAGRKLAARIESVNLIVERVPHVPAQPYPGLNHLRRLSIDLREYLPPWMIDVLIDLPFVRRLERFDCDSSLGLTTQQLERLLTRPALQRLTFCDFEARRVGQKWDLVIHAPASWGTMTLLGRLSPLRTMVNTLTVAPAPGQPRDEAIQDLESHLRDVLEGGQAWVEDPLEDAPF